jgi:hypothetical protein
LIEPRASTYQRSREALREFEEDAKKGLTYHKWLSVCEGLSEARREALEQLGLTHTNLPTYRVGGGFNKVFGAILRREHLSSEIIDSKTRGDTFNVIEHRVEIEQWREGLDPVKRARLNHPQSIWREFKKMLPKDRRSTPKKKKTSNRVMPREPKIESWAQPGSGKPSEEQIKRAEEKQAREAEQEAAALERQDTDREELQKMRIERAGFLSEIEELKNRVANLNAPLAPPSQSRTEPQSIDPTMALKALINGEVDLSGFTRRQLLKLAFRAKQLAAQCKEDVN